MPNWSMTNERYEKLSKGGDIDALCMYLHEQSGVAYRVVVKKLPEMLKLLTPKQRYIMQEYYFLHSSIIDIKYQLGGNSAYSRIEDTIKRSTAKILKLLKLAVEINEGGVKNEETTKTKN